jgi:hypothetical protein
VAVLLAQRDAAAVAARVAALDGRAGPVRDAFHSFGTCSIDDPRTELTALGLLDPTPDPTHQGAS